MTLERVAPPKETVVSIVPNEANCRLDDNGLLSEHEDRRIAVAMERFAAVPIEGLGEPCSGVDHKDRQYGNR